MSKRNKIRKRQWLICIFTGHKYSPVVCSYCWKVEPEARKKTGVGVVVLIGGVEEVLSRVPRDKDVMHFADGKEFRIKRIT